MHKHMDVFAVAGIPNADDSTRLSTGTCSSLTAISGNAKDAVDRIRRREDQLNSLVAEKKVEFESSDKQLRELSAMHAQKQKSCEEKLHELHVTDAKMRDTEILVNEHSKSVSDSSPLVDIKRCGSRIVCPHC